MVVYITRSTCSSARVLVYSQAFFLLARIASLLDTHPEGGVNIHRTRMYS